MFFLPSRTRRRFERNNDKDITPAMDGEGLLNGQGRDALRELSFGHSSVGHAGCESIAVYNALALLGLSRPLPEVIRAMERGGYMRFGGYMGAAPYFQPMLRHFGATTRAIRPARLQREAERGTLPTGAVFLVSIWNDRFRPYKGMHTFTVRYVPDARGDWQVWNRYNSDASSRFYRTLGDILQSGRHRGRFLVIYRVERKKSLHRLFPF